MGQLHAGASEESVCWAPKAGDVVKLRSIVGMACVLPSRPVLPFPPFPSPAAPTAYLLQAASCCVCARLKRWPLLRLPSSLPAALLRAIRPALCSGGVRQNKTLGMLSPDATVLVSEGAHIALSTTPRFLRQPGDSKATGRRRQQGDSKAIGPQLSTGDARGTKGKRGGWGAAGWLLPIADSGKRHTTAACCLCGRVPPPPLAMPKFSKKKTPPPEGWDLIEPTIAELDAKMREGTHCRGARNPYLSHPPAPMPDLTHHLNPRAPLSPPPHKLPGTWQRSKSLPMASESAKPSGRL
jgi:hypothetical protein